MIGKRKLTALVSSLMAGVIFMSACSVNMNGIGEAFTDLGENLNQAAHDNNEEAAPAAEDDGIEEPAMMFTKPAEGSYDAGDVPDVVPDYAEEDPETETEASAEEHVPAG